jgi:cobalamin biosynthesis protein CobT
MEEKKNLPPSNHDFSKDGTLTEGNIKFKKSDSNKDNYFKDLTKINSTKAQVLAKLFSRKSKDYTFSMKSMRSGRLDTNKLAEAKQMVPTIYERFGQVTTNKINIGVVIDESGSMGSGAKMQKARQAAIFINEVFKKQQDVQLFIYGHTADESSGYGDCNIRIYREPGVNMDPYALGSCKARANNRDGDAIYACAKRIRSKTTDPGLIFVISDGAPYAYDYSGQQAISDTRKKVTMAQALGFQVIQIAIEEEVPCDEMFDYYIQMTNIENLPNDMIAYVSKKVDKLIKEKTIM